MALIPLVRTIDTFQKFIKIKIIKNTFPDNPGVTKVFSNIPELPGHRRLASKTP